MRGMDGRADAGLDLKWEVRPGLVLDGTVNPDFSQVEADEERVNLTRFSLFFPEKRDFFLENAGVFEFGSRGSFETPPFLLFFSRRIGLDDDEEEVPVRGGVRLTGRAGAADRRVHGRVHRPQSPRGPRQLRGGSVQTRRGGQRLRGRDGDGQAPPGLRRIPPRASTLPSGPRAR